MTCSDDILLPKVRKRRNAEMRAKTAIKDHDNDTHYTALCTCRNGMIRFISFQPEKTGRRPLCPDICECM